MSKIKEIIILRNLTVIGTDAVMPVTASVDFHYNDKYDTQINTTTETVYEYHANGALGHMTYRSRTPMTPNDLLTRIIDTAAHDIRLIREAEQAAFARCCGLAEEVKHLKARICDLNDRISELQ